MRNTARLSPTRRAPIRTLRVLGLGWLVCGALAGLARADGGEPELGPWSEISYDDAATTPDVAYLRADDVYLAVYSALQPSGFYHVYASSIDASTGALTSLLIDSGFSSIPNEPRVAAFASAGRFAITFLRNDHLFVRTYAPSSGLVTPAIQLSTGSAIKEPSSPSIAGRSLEAEFGSGYGLVTWERRDIITNDSEVVAHSIRVLPTDAAPLIPDERFVIGPGRVPVCSSGSGSAGRFVVAFERNFKLLATTFTLDTLGLPFGGVGPSLVIDSFLPSNPPTELSLAGGPSRFLLAWQRGDDDVFYQRLETPISGPSILPVGPLEEISAPGKDLRRPDVSWSGDRYLLAYEEGDDLIPGSPIALSNTAVRLISISFFTGEVEHDYGAFLSFGSSPIGGPVIQNNTRPALCSQREGSQDGGDRFRIVTDGGAIRSTEVRPTGGGAIAQIGAPCNGGGYLSITNGPALNAPFNLFFSPDEFVPLSIITVHSTVEPLALGGCELLAAVPGAINEQTELLTVPALTESALIGLTLRAQGASMKFDGSIASSQILEFTLSD